jgi:predicted dehydrogenase
MDKVRVGVIGCGGISNKKHMPALKKLPNVEMVAFCDVVEERAVKQRLISAHPTQKPTLIIKSCLRIKRST